MNGKERADLVSKRLYDKDWEALSQPLSKYRALAVALQEAEDEIEKLKIKIKQLEKK